MGNFDLSSAVTGGSSLLGSIISSVGAAKVNKKQIEYNKWAQENQQQFNALEAQKARDYQTQFYEQYQSPSAMVKQYQEAGLNPALSYNGGTNTPPSATSATSGMSSISPQNTLQFFEQLGGMIGNMFLLKSQIDKTESEADYFKSLTKGQDISNEFNPLMFSQNLKQGELNLQNTEVGINLALSQININNEQLINFLYSRARDIASIRQMDSQTLTEYFKQALITAQTVTETARGKQISLDNFAKEWRNEFIRTKNVNPELAQGMWGLLTQALGSLTDVITYGVNTIKDSTTSWLSSNPFNFILNSFQTKRVGSPWSNYQTR